MQQYRVWIASRRDRAARLVPRRCPARKKPQTPAAAGGQSPSDRIRMTGQLKIGYRTDARPLSFRDESGKPAGILGGPVPQVIADQLKAERGHGTLAVEWVPLEAAERFAAVQQGRVDILCGRTRRPWPAGPRSRSRSRSSRAASGRCSGPTRPRASRTPWTGRSWPPSPTGGPMPPGLLSQRFAVMTGTNVETCRGQAEAVRLKLDCEGRAGETAMTPGSSGCSIARPRSSSAIARSFWIAARRDSVLGQAHGARPPLHHEALALVFARGDEDFRLFVDKALSGFYASGDVTATYAKWFGGRARRSPLLSQGRAAGLRSSAAACASAGSDAPGGHTARLTEQGENEQ